MSAHTVQARSHEEIIVTSVFSTFDTENKTTDHELNRTFQEKKTQKKILEKREREKKMTESISTKWKDIRRIKKYAETTKAHQKTIQANIRNKIDSGEMGENPIKR